MSMSVSGLSTIYGVQAVTGASPRMTPDHKMAKVFAKIDTGGSGSIAKGQFMQAFQTMKPTAGFVAMGAAAVYRTLDPNNTGTVSKQAFVQGMTQLMAQFRSAASSNP
jgi:hypothetical protein